MDNITLAQDALQFRVLSVKEAILNRDQQEQLDRHRQKATLHHFLDITGTTTSSIFAPPFSHVYYKGVTQKAPNKSARQKPAFKRTKSRPHLTAYHRAPSKITRVKTLSKQSGG